MIIKILRLRILFCLLLVFITFSCRNDFIDKNLVGDWELVNIYYTKSSINSSKNDDKETVFMNDFITIDKYGNFIIVLLSMDKQLKGKFIEDKDYPHRLKVLNASDSIYMGLYKYDLFEYDNLVYLKLESDNVVINARRNPVIMNLP